ncbi:MULTISPECIES: hypothetical protein [Cupriavidus]|uniref:hypothetical protein n=1 Tax=Cupriavidus TaxID=106589 RepID=UPI0011ED5F19|nr:MULTISPECIES: hypothetical protein [Cupriavidus]MWL91747.1 hypothetical protein [Cupriavidus sp. SW-Y-13]
MVISYLDRNLKWLFPLFAILVLLLTPELLEIAHSSLSIPASLQHIGIAFAFLLGGIGATLTDTISAKLVRVLGLLLLTLGVVWSL